MCRLVSNIYALACTPHFKYHPKIQNQLGIKPRKDIAHGTPHLNIHITIFAASEENISTSVQSTTFYNITRITFATLLVIVFRIRCN